MQIFNYDNNGRFIGASEADISPLEPSEYLIPALATDKEPLSSKDGFEIYWNGNDWEYKEIPKEKPMQPNEFSVWDEESWSWIDDEKLKSEYELKQKIAEAIAYLSETDWVEPYVLRHELGINVLPADSNKLAIKAKREETLEFLKAN